MSKAKAEWVVMGGKPDEWTHCTRCGDGLGLGLSQPIPIAVAALKAFVKVHAKCLDTGRKEERPATPAEWAQGRDTGVSSGTIYSVMTGTRGPSGNRDIPHDPDDFGRCYRLLKLFPEWRPRMGEVAVAFPAWKPFVSEWDKLTAMYEAAIVTPRTPATEMYRFMKQLEEQSE